MKGKEFELNFIKFQMEWEHVKNGSVYRGWAHSSINLRMGFSNPAHIESLLPEVARLKTEMSSIRSALESNLSLIYPMWSVHEWLLTHFEPTANQIESLYNSLSKILDKTAFPVRPFEYNQTLEDL